jgi:hypothetical protein
MDTTINITNKQTKDAAAAVPFLRTTTRQYTKDGTDADATNTRLRANLPKPKHPPTKRQELKHERTPCSRPSGRPPKPPNMRRHTHAGASRRSPTHAAEGVVTVAVVVVRHAVECRADQPATQASRQTSNEQSNCHNQHNKQTNKRRRRRRLILANNNTTLYRGHTALPPAHSPTHPRPSAPTRPAATRTPPTQTPPTRGSGQTTNTQTPANQAARSKTRTHNLLAPKRTSAKAAKHAPPHTRGRVAT